MLSVAVGLGFLLAGGSGLEVGLGAFYEADDIFPVLQHDDEHGSGGENYPRHGHAEKCGGCKAGHGGSYGAERDLAAQHCRDEKHRERRGEHTPVNGQKYRSPGGKDPLTAAGELCGAAPNKNPPRVFPGRCCKSRYSGCALEAQTVLTESLKILGGTIRRNGDGAGELQTEYLHKALSIHHP